MKRFGLLALMSVLVLGLALYFVSCGGGGGGTAGGGNPLVNYSSPSQAASSSGVATAAMSVFSAISSAADLADTQIPGIAARTGASIAYRPMLLGAVLKEVSGMRDRVVVVTKGGIRASTYSNSRSNHSRSRRFTSSPRPRQCGSPATVLRLP